MHSALDACQLQLQLRAIHYPRIISTYTLHKTLTYYIKTLRAIINQEGQFYHC